MPTKQLGDLPVFSLEYTKHLREILVSLDNDALARVAAELLSARRCNRRIYVLGNGGSAATAAHIACDLGHNTGRFSRIAFRVIALVDNVPTITALSNDRGYETIFEQQLESLCEPGDVVMCFSASGNSPNILNALKAAQRRGAVSIAFLGFDGGAAKSAADISVVIGCRNYGLVEDVHLVMSHIITQYLAGSVAVAEGGKYIT